MQVQPYLMFDGRTDEALAFYKKVLSAEVTMLMRFKENPDAGKPGAEGCGPGGMDIDPEKVMHCEFKIGSTALLASDGMCTGKPQFQGVSFALSAPDVAKAEQWFGALGEGGQVQMPMAQTFFSERFGMVADKFGVSWMVLVESKR
ncbi:VOC family protein [Variovorax dokdonensis]|uniref:VOC family protein n=1 Tax=Variovorax dokdonensis TaxID=344883 RepID=A0ABT7NBA4_9BURK|nr:VOC family protein [Variovorax dokdonensis]MDM0045229.1 VOC family protein [Variovorax dokdonensis]